MATIETVRADLDQLSAVIRTWSSNIDEVDRAIADLQAEISRWLQRLDQEPRPMFAERFDQASRIQDLIARVIALVEEHQ